MIRNTPYGKRIQSKIQRESMDPLRGSQGYHPAMVAGGYFMAPPHMSAHPQSHHHHVPPMLDTRHATSFMTNTGATSNSGSHQLLSASHAHHPGSQTQMSAAGFSTPWSATSPTGPVPLSYGGLSLTHDPQTSSYAPFM